MPPQTQTTQNANTVYYGARNVQIGGGSTGMVPLAQAGTIVIDMTGNIFLGGTNGNTINSAPWGQWRVDKGIWYRLTLGQTATLVIGGTRYTITVNWKPEFEPFGAIIEAKGGTKGFLKAVETFTPVQTSSQAPAVQQSVQAAPMQPAPDNNATQQVYAPQVQAQPQPTTGAPVANQAVQAVLAENTNPIKIKATVKRGWILFGVSLFILVIGLWFGFASAIGAATGIYGAGVPGLRVKNKPLMIAGFIAGGLNVALLLLAIFSR